MRDNVTADLFADIDKVASDLTTRDSPLTWAATTSTLVDLIYSLGEKLDEQQFLTLLDVAALARRQSLQAPIVDLASMDAAAASSERPGSVGMRSSRSFVETGDYPFVPAAGKTDTSATAAASIGKSCGRIQRTVLLAIAEVGARGLTAEELATRVGMERTTVQPRTTELMLQGLIRKSGQRRPNRNGKKAIVWVVTGGVA